MRRHKIEPFILTLGLASVLCGCSKIVAKAQSTEEQSRKNVRLIVYKQDFGQVSEDRPVQLKAGHNQVGLQDVSKSLDQGSVIFSWPDKSTDADVVATTYDLGISEGGSMLKRFLGKNVDVVRYGENGKEADRVQGVLQVADPGDVVVEANGKYLINPEGSIEAPGGGIVAIPQLSAQVESKSQKNADLDVTYQTLGLSWSSDYVATLDPTSDMMKLELWASVTNKTGIDYPEAKISLVAGQPNRADTTLKEGAYLNFQTRTVTTDAVNNIAGEPQVATRPVGELYSYDLPDNATISQNQTNRVKVLTSDKVLVKKDYALRLPPLGPAYYGNNTMPSNSQNINATLSISFNNLLKNGLGEPLPEGAVRVYEAGKDGTPTNIGAADIPDTPRKAGAYLTLSSVFDVYGQMKALSAKKVDRKTVDEKIEIDLTNQKAGPIDLRVVEEMGSHWKVMDETDKSTKTNPNENQWKVHLKPGENKKILATVRFSY
jgi:hypothetical protein